MFLFILKSKDIVLKVLKLRKLALIATGTMFIVN
jgi:hypothetical protein